MTGVQTCALPISDRGRISSLSPLVSEAARAGDASALAIFQQAAREEADLVDAIVRQLFADAPDASVPVTYVGGTFRAGDLILGPLGRALPASTRLVAPLHGPELGPILLLQRGIEVSG